MNIQTNVTYYIKGLSDRLKVVRPTMIESLCELFANKYVFLFPEYTIKDVDFFYFEYDYETLDIVVWAENKAKEVISSWSMSIPPTLTDSLFSKVLRDELMNLGESWIMTNRGEEMYYELIEVLAEQQGQVLESWFIQCWSEAKTKTGVSVKGKFSIHDTIYRTDLP